MLTPTDRRHGTPAGWHAGCGCTPCHRARLRQAKELRIRVALHGPRLIDPTGTSRRVRALARMGWTNRQIAEAAGWRWPQSVGRAMYPTGPIHVATAARVQRAYDALSMVVPPDTWRARVRRDAAEADGWPSPLAWDDDTMDNPATEPAGHVPTAAGNGHRVLHLDAVEELARECGATYESVAERLGVQPKSVATFLRRHGAKEAQRLLELRGSERAHQAQEQHVRYDTSAKAG